MESENCQIWHCNICDLKITVQSTPSSNDFTTVTRHLFKHVKTDKVYCPECKMPFQNYQYFVNHVNKHKKREEYNLKFTSEKTCPLPVNTLPEFSVTAIDPICEIQPIVQDLGDIEQGCFAQKPKACTTA